MYPGIWGSTNSGKNVYIKTNNYVRISFWWDLIYVFLARLLAFQWVLMIRSYPYKQMIYAIGWLTIYLFQPSVYLKWSNIEKWVVFIYKITNKSTNSVIGPRKYRSLLQISTTTREGFSHKHPYLTIMQGMSLSMLQIIFTKINMHYRECQYSCKTVHWILDYSPCAGKYFFCNHIAITSCLLNIRPCCLELAS